jgi:uncharacterized protein (DUF302 family)
MMLCLQPILRGGLVIAVALVFGCVDSQEPEKKEKAVSSPETGLVHVASAHSAAETVQRFEKILQEKKVEIFAKVDHAAGAKKADMPLRPTTVILFGNPQVGTPLMQSKQTAGIDLPLKALIWEDEAGKVWLTYNRADYVAKRHGVSDREDTVKAMNGALEALARAATAK